MSRFLPGAGATTCRHLLVPVDETDESMTTVVETIERARIAGARITFFHAPAHIRHRRHAVWRCVLKSVLPFDMMAWRWGCIRAAAWRTPSLISRATG